jgi:NADP-dependent 3-hydroxy acid dehydrogenase YdfG
MTRVLITGCSSGIGRACAIELTKRGFEVIATARKPETLDELDVTEKLALDVTDEASIAAAVRAAGQIDVLINNAGFSVSGPIEKVPVDEVKRLYDTNVFGCVRMIQAVLPQMRERGSGTVVNISSVAGRTSQPLGGYYSSSKFALEAISEALHYECGHFGIRVIVIEPGGFESSIGEKSPDPYGVAEPPYDELAALWTASEDLIPGRESSPGSEVAAQLIADAIESDERKLRWPIGEDAKVIVETRDSMSFEDFEATMRSVLQLDW